LDRFALLRVASLLVQKAVHEGFGLSLLDAFAEGIPWPVQNTSFLPEVGGDAAAFFDPYDVDNISDVLQQVRTHPLTRRDFLQRKPSGLIVLDPCARKTLKLLQCDN